MHVQSLRLYNFRNYGNEQFAFDPAVNLICGPNGQGKTNLLEAVAALSTMRLFRTSQKKKACGSTGQTRAFRAAFLRSSGILRLNSVCSARNPWRSTKTACGKGGRATRRGF